MKRLTYKDAGVDIDAGNEFAKALKPVVRKTLRPEVLGRIGGFGALFDARFKRYKNPVLVSSSDGVGTKLKLAFMTGKHETVGIDLVAMNVDDIVTLGAEPLFFLDYIATGKLKKHVLVDVVKGIARGCQEAGCALIGGETAELPDFYNKDEYDLAGFCVGVVDKERIIDGSNVRPGDVILGLASSGLHSNGYSLVRRVFSKNELKKHARELLKPTKIYAKAILSFLSTLSSQPSTIKTIAHITGGGFYDNIPRVLPAGTSALIYKQAWSIPKVFTEIQKRANIDEKEMFRTFNMGIGMILIVKKGAEKKALRHFAKNKQKAFIIGKVIKGNKEVLI